MHTQDVKAKKVRSEVLIFERAFNYVRTPCASTGEGFDRRRSYRPLYCRTHIQRLLSKSDELAQKYWNIFS